ncbi:MAG: prolyl oligopeptidase family serine peptidase [Luteibaculaceae bacterium]
MQHKKTVSILAFAGLLSACGTSEKETAQVGPQLPLTYPVTKKVDTVHTYFGVEIADPFQWLEDDNSDETKAWVTAQNELTFGFLNQIPFKQQLRDRFEELFNYKKVGSPSLVGDYKFYYANDGLQNQAVIYFKKGEDGDEKVFIDPNTLSEKGTVSIGLLGADENDALMAYSYSEAGSDWQEIRVRDIESNTDLDDVVKWVKFSGAAWYKDGFFYSRYPEPKEEEKLSGVNKFHSVYYHKIGTPQSEDKLVYRDEKNPLMYHNVYTTEDKAYLVMSKSTGTDGYETWIMKLDEQDKGFKPLFSGFKNKSSVINHIDGHFLVRTDIGAPNYQVVKVDPKKPAQENWVVVIPEKDEKLNSASTGGGFLWANYLKDVSTRIYRYNLDGANELEVQLPGIGSAGGFGGKKEDTVFYYSFTSFTYPNTVFKYDIASNTSEVYFSPTLKFNPEDYETKQVFYPSKDGTKVPMFIVHKKGLELNGANPTYLYAYGGFNISLTPSFSVSNLLLLEQGGVYALANLRGGGEYGEAWHKAGMLMNKQNVFDDFIAAAEYLIEEKYTSSNHLAVAGGSNGGLLVGAVMTQRPELFKVAFPAVGVLDMLRFHKFTVGWGWVPEYGSSEQSEEMFRYLLGYSPLHNLVPANYPATMVTTADHDDRVVPAHSFKFAAKLQEVHTGINPVLIRIAVDAGHGAGKPTSKILDEEAEKWAFMLWNVGVRELK